MQVAMSELVAEFFLVLFGRQRLRAGKTNNKKTHKRTLHGNVPAFSRDCPGDCPSIFLRFPGIVSYCVAFSPARRQHINNFDPPPVLPGTIPKSCLCSLLCWSPARETKSKQKTPRICLTLSKSGLSKV